MRFFNEATKKSSSSQNNLIDWSLKYNISESWMLIIIFLIRKQLAFATTLAASQRFCEWLNPKLRNEVESYEESHSYRPTLCTSVTLAVQFPTKRRTTTSITLYERRRPVRCCCSHWVCRLNDIFRDHLWHAIPLPSGNSLETEHSWVVVAYVV